MANQTSRHPNRIMQMYRKTHAHNADLFYPPSHFSACTRERLVRPKAPHFPVRIKIASEDKGVNNSSSVNSRVSHVQAFRNLFTARFSSVSHAHPGRHPYKYIKRRRSVHNQSWKTKYGRLSLRPPRGSGSVSAEGRSWQQVGQHSDPPAGANNV